MSPLCHHPGRAFAPLPRRMNLAPVRAEIAKAAKRPFLLYT